MMQFLKRDNRYRHQLKLVSVHIPKTAGTSFRNTLREVYGEEYVVRLDINLEREQIRLNEHDWSGSKLAKKVQVAHGHFSPALFEKYFQETEADFITWLRHPVKRVISNYYYLVKRLEEELQEQEKGLNILSKLQRSLEEYAAAPLNQNRISKFLAGRTLKDFTFVGIQEHYEEDLHRLAKRLNWSKVPHFKHNVTGKKYEVPTKIRDKIAAYNQDDMRLYERGLVLREQYKE